MAIDWKPYERQVNRWYLDEGKTANEVIQLLLENHSLVVTPRQFKAKFGGCKKISSKEWSILIPKIREREANGLKSVIYVCGKAIKHESMARSIRRYAKPCTDVSQSKATVDIGIDTIGQHRIEIRAPSEPGAQLPWDFSITEVQPSNEGENSSNSQSDEVDVDEEFGPVEMDIELGDLVSAGNAIYPSPSMFPGTLDQLPLGLSDTFLLENVNEISMEINEQVLPRSQWSLLSPTNPTMWSPSGHAFTCYWDIPEISSFVLNGCQALGLATQLGIFVPEPDQNDPLPNLDLTTVQAETLKPIIQSIKEITSPQKPLLLQRGDRTIHYYSSNLLDIADNQSLCQALLVIVYMVSNNLLDEDETDHLVDWILERGHASKLLAFSRQRTVDHLAFGSAFLRALSKATDKCIPCSGPGHLADFLCSGEFLNLIKSHRRDLSGPLGIKLFRLAICIDSIQLATLLVSHGADFKSGSTPEDRDEALRLAASLDRGSILEYLISLGVDVNADFAGCSALMLAVRRHNQLAVQTLLDAGARMSENDRDYLEDRLFAVGYEDSPIINALIEKIPHVNSLIVCRELVNAARQGNRELSKVSLTHGIVSQQGLEYAMCRAIKWDDLAATRTFLQRGTNPNVGMAAFRDRLDSSRGRYRSYPVDMFYLLVKAGAQLSDETALSVQRFLSLTFDPEKNKVQAPQLLLILLRFGYDKAWVHQYLLTLWAIDGSIFECDTCMSRGASINGYAILGQSALQLAAGNGHFALVQHLISQGADPNLPPSSDSPNGQTALYAALIRGHWQIAAYLIDSGSDVTKQATTAGTSFLEGVLSSSKTTNKSREDMNTHFRNLLALGAPIHSPKGTDCFILHGLILRDQLDSLELVLKAGARIEAKCGGTTPIQIATGARHLDALRLLLKYGANINGCLSPVGNHTTAPTMPSPTPMHTLRISHQSRDLARLKFIHLSSDSGFLRDFYVDDEPYFPHTPLQIASSSCDPDLDIIKLLLSHEADINAPAAEWYGRTALQGAASARTPSMDVVKLLLDWGADVNAPPARVGGISALQGAAIRGNIQLARLLLAKGADLNAPGAPEEGRTALEGAAEHGRMEMLRFLLSKGVIPDFVTGYSRAIELAENELHLGIAKFLREEQGKLHKVGWGLGTLVLI